MDTDRKGKIIKQAKTINNNKDKRSQAEKDF